MNGMTRDEVEIVEFPRACRHIYERHDQSGTLGQRAQARLG